LEDNQTQTLKKPVIRNFRLVSKAILVKEGGSVSQGTLFTLVKKIANNEKYSYNINNFIYIFLLKYIS